MVDSDVSLQEVNAEINKLDGGYTPPLNDLETPVMNPVPEVATPEGASEAEGLLVQAELMEQDAKVMLQEAEAKKTQAYALAPELAPKKGPGRPKKVVTE